MQTTTIQIRHMTCGHCVRAVEEALRRLPNVRDVKVTVGEAVITTDGLPDMAVIRHAIQEEGYELA